MTDKTICAQASRPIAAVAFALLLIVQASAQQPPPPPAPVPQILQAYKPVTAERLKKPEDGDWLMIRRTYDGWGYSPLDQITRANVSRLQPVWSFSTGQVSGHEAPPIVNNGVMFVATPGNQVIAIEAKTGTVLWRYRQDRCAETPSCSTGPAAAWLSMATRCISPPATRCWSRSMPRQAKKSGPRKVEENKNGYYMTNRAARRRRQGDGRRLGRRAWHPRFRRGVRRRDRERRRGKPLRCRRRASPAAKRGRPAATSGKPAAPRRGSRAITIRRRTWCSGVPATAARGWATSGPATTSTPRRRSRSTSRPARSRATISTSRTSRGTGTRSRRRSWSTSSGTARTIKGLINVARNGYLWFLERTNGKINFVEGKPFVKQNVFKSLDPVTGRPDVDPAHKPGDRQAGRSLPVALGRQELAPDRVQSGHADDLHSGERKYLRDLDRAAKSSTCPAAASPARRPASILAPGAEHIGEVQAWNVDTGQRVWTHRFAKSPNWGPMLATARRPRVQRRHQRSDVSRLRRAETETSCGSSRPTPASSASRRRSWSTAGNTLPCSRVGASTREACRRA